MAPCLSLIPFISIHAIKSQHPLTSTTTKAIPKREPQERAFQGTYVNKLQDRLFAFLGSGFAQTFSHIISRRVKTLSNTKLVIVKQVEREKASLPVDVHHSKCLHLLKLLPMIKQACLLNKRPLLSPLTFLKQQGYKENLFLFPIY